MENKIYRFYTLSSSDEPERVRYVGVTQSTIKNRFQEHKGRARGNPKRRSQPVHKWMYSKYMQNIDIICTEIDQCSESEWKDREKYWISYYRKLEPELLNLQSGGSGVVTKEMRNIEGQERSRLAHIKPVAAYDKTGNLIEAFESVTAAANFYNINKTNISSAALGKIKTCHGFIWKFLKKEDIVDLEKYNKRVVVYKYNSNNEIVQTYQSVRQVFREINGKDSGGTDYFTKKVLDKSKLWNGFYWATIADFKINDQNYACKEVTSEGELVELFRHKSDVAKKYNVSLDTIYHRIKTHKPLDNGHFIEKY